MRKTENAENIENTGKIKKKQSTIMTIRRKQIIEAAIQTLNEMGYLNTSLNQIAQRAGVSQALISYHFKDKLDLMEHTLGTLMENLADYIKEEIASRPCPVEKLHAYITANLVYYQTYPERNKALVEILFNAQTNIPHHQRHKGTQEPLLLQLQQILREGQAAGKFVDFRAQTMTNAIHGAIGEHLKNAALGTAIDAQEYAKELIGIFDQSVMKQPPLVCHNLSCNERSQSTELDADASSEPQE